MKTQENVDNLKNILYIFFGDKDIEFLNRIDYYHSFVKQMYKLQKQKFNPMSMSFLG